MLMSVAKSVYPKLPPVVAQPLKRLWARGYMKFSHDDKLREEVAVSVKKINELCLYHDGQKIFVDCGFNSGFVLRETLERLPAFKAYGFEVNENAFKKDAERLKKENPRILSLDFAAVADHDGEVTFHENGYGFGSCPYQGSSIVSGVNDDREGREVTVGCIDFSDWIKNTFNEHSNGNRPFIAVKMDIEGAEYDVLEGLIKTGAINHISHLSIEWHSRCFPGGQREQILERENKIRSNLSQVSGLTVREWV